MISRTFARRFSIMLFVWELERLFFSLNSFSIFDKICRFLREEICERE